MAIPSDAERDELSFTERRLVDQLGHLVPQIHLTLVSVLQGIALVFLLAAFRGPSSNSLSAFWAALLDHHLYLPHIVSFLIIIIAWNEYAYATLLLHWPLTAFSTALQFAFAVVEIAAFTSVDTVGTWAVWIGVASLLGAFIHQRNVSVTSGELYPYGDIAGITTGRSDWSAWALGLYVVLGALRLFATAPFTFAVTIASVHLVLFDFLIPLCTFAMTIFIMTRDNAYYISTLNNVFEKSRSPYRLAENGRIRKPRSEPET